MKKCRIAFSLALVSALALTGCKAEDFLLYLYGGDDFIEKEMDPAYAAFDAENGVSFVYDTTLWQAPQVPQADTVSLASGGKLDYTAVLLQTSDAYTDFLAQSGAELEKETSTVKYDFSFTVPDATVQSVRYDCGEYQTIFAQINYRRGGTIYVTAATRLADYTPITDLLQNVYPAGETPESAAALRASRETALAEQKSLA